MSFSRESFSRRFLSRVNDKRHVGLVMKQFDFRTYFAYKVVREILDTQNDY